jgi:hypothetical protein
MFRRSVQVATGCQSHSENGSGVGLWSSASSARTRKIPNSRPDPDAFVRRKQARWRSCTSCGELDGQRGDIDKGHHDVDTPARHLDANNSLGAVLGEIHTGRCGDALPHSRTAACPLDSLAIRLRFVPARPASPMSVPYDHTRQPLMYLLSTHARGRCEGRCSIRSP